MSVEIWTYICRLTDSSEPHLILLLISKERQLLLSGLRRQSVCQVKRTKQNWRNWIGRWVGNSQKTLVGTHKLRVSKIQPKPIYLDWELRFFARIDELCQIGYNQTLANKISPHCLIHFGWQLIWISSGNEIIQGSSSFWSKLNYSNIFLYLKKKLFECYFTFMNQWLTVFYGFLWIFPSRIFPFQSTIHYIYKTNKIYDIEPTKALTPN